jgi:hypothetical protein
MRLGITAASFHKSVPRSNSCPCGRCDTGATHSRRSERHAIPPGVFKGHSRTLGQGSGLEHEPEPGV